MGNEKPANNNGAPKLSNVPVQEAQVEAKKSNGNRVAEQQPALMGVALAGVIALIVGEGPFDYWGTVIGCTLLLILVAYDTPTERLRQQLACGAVYTLCLVLIFGFVLNFIVDEPDPGHPTKFSYNEAWGTEFDLTAPKELFVLGFWFVTTGLATLVRNGIYKLSNGQ